MISTAVILFGAAVAALAQTVAGFGFALVAVPIFVLVLTVPEAVGTAAFLSFVNALAVASQARRDVAWPLVKRLFLGSLLGMPFGLAVLLGSSGDLLRVGVGVVSILMAAAIVASVPFRTPGRVGTIGVGVASGFLTTSIAINGPPVVLFLQALGVPQGVFRATSSAFFVVNGVVSLSVFALSGVIGAETMLRILWALPALLAGNLLGHLLLPRVGPSAFRRLVLGLLVVSASLSLLEGLRGLWD